MKILFLTAELFPIIKTGGLADYSEALPKAFRHDKDIDMRIMLPSYPSVMLALKDARLIAEAQSVLTPSRKIQIIEGKMKEFPFPILVVHCPALYNRPGSPYVDRSGKDWEDNFERFATLGMAPYLMIKQGTQWTPDIVHANDWHTGLFSAYFRLLPQRLRPGSVFTIHNISFQGNFPEKMFAKSGLPQEQYSMHGLEFFGEMSFLKAGVNFSEKITTVSPRYATETKTTDEFGLGFSGILSAREKDYIGILNGVDYKLWSPARDLYLRYTYSDENLANKSRQKKHFQESVGLSPANGSFLIASVSRLSHQKGLDLAVDVLENVLKNYPSMQFVCVGMGDKDQGERIEKLMHHYPKQVCFFNAYNEELAHQAIASSDAFLMPSRFEPCGLTQLYALKYGSIPLVTPVGGLLDTILPYKELKTKTTGNGFIADNVSLHAIRKMILTAYDIFNYRKKSWSALMKNAMKANFSWEKFAKEYKKIYEELMKKPS